MRMSEDIEYDYGKIEKIFQDNNDSIESIFVSEGEKRFSFRDTPDRLSNNLDEARRYLDRKFYQGHRDDAPYYLMAYGKNIIVIEIHSMPRMDEGEGGRLIIPRNHPCEKYEFTLSAWGY